MKQANLPCGYLVCEDAGCTYIHSASGRILKKELELNKPNETAREPKKGRREVGREKENELRVNCAKPSTWDPVISGHWWALTIP